MRPVTLDVQLGRIEALRNDGSGRRVLALHGWLDNAASFVPLAPRLANLDLVAIDLPGHGRSVHLPAGAEYGFATAIGSVLDCADALGWDRFCLLGHSMGAGIATLLAAACPERIEALVAVEMLGALAYPEGQTGMRMQQALAASRKLDGKSLRVFPDVDSAVRARMHASQVPGSGVDAELVRLLVERGLREVPGGFAWSSDPRLTVPTLSRLTEAQVDDILRAIDCKVLAVFADPAQPYLPDDLRRHRASLLRHGKLVTMPGGHHLHMQQTEAVAEAITAFLAD